MGDGLGAFVEEEIDVGVLEAAGVDLECGVRRVEGDLAGGNDFVEGGFDGRRNDLRGRAAWREPGRRGGVGGSWAEVSTVAKAKSAGVAARASRMVLPEMMEGVLPRKRTLPPPLARALRRSSSVWVRTMAEGMMTVLVGVAAHGFEGAGAGFEVGGEGVLVDDVEVDLAFGEHLFGGDEGGVGVAIVEPHGAGREVEGDRGGRGGPCS